MRRLPGYFGIGLMIFFTFGCQEDIDVFEPATLSSGDIMRFFGSVQTAPLQHNWDVSEEQTIVVPGEGQVIIPANAFTQMDGSPVSGLVQANLLEIHDKGSLIRFNIGTSSGGRILQLVSMINLDVRQEGRPLRLASGQTILIRLATTAYRPEMRLFTAAPADSGAIEWMEAPDTEKRIQAAQVFDPATDQWLEGIEISATSLGWMQCALYANTTSGGKVPACVKLPIGFTKHNTAVFLTLQNMNSVVPFNAFDETLPQVCQQGLPAGSKAEIIVISEGDEEEYYFARQPIIISENLKISVVPQKALLSDILFALDNL
ncbi:MAG: hypothetical protein KDD02_03150 [Phaeodactylibacter sp.]|nr:hypothetical protein [Phaeodactylibacter sp.]MCB9302187.1 hypothetical protein [Lewinellaceae bacterium]HQU60029.1 hypothetical protein [Saprospiraceae bacterium]